jgi:hypothetical protein
MNNFWAMGGGWIIALAVLITIFWLAAKLINRNGNSRSHK